MRELFCRQKLERIIRKNTFATYTTKRGKGFNSIKGTIKTVADLEVHEMSFMFQFHKRYD